MHRGRLGRLAAWHLTGGPVGPPAKWAATSIVEVGQTIYPVRMERSEGQSHREEREGENGTGRWSTDP